MARSPPKRSAPETRPSPLVQAAWRGAGIAYGLLSLGVLGFWAVWDGYIFRRPGSSFWKQVEAAREAHWNLSSRPFPSFSHNFYSLSPTRQIHYLANSSPAGTKHKTLIIFIHGWPDSALMWRQVLQSLPSSVASSAKMIAPDIPGFGGSDTAFPSFGPDGLLSPLATFILAMREQHLDDSDPDARVILVAHDWGAAIGYRLAAEAPQLADRFILINGAIGHQFQSNIAHRAFTASKLFKQWLSAPSRLRLLGSAFSTIRPVLRQIKSSTYIAVYNLPAPLPGFFGWLGSTWFLRFACSLAVGSQFCVTTAAAATHLASAIGPPSKALSTLTSDEKTYGADVRRRIKSGRFFESVRIYREGILNKRWEKDLELIASLHALDTSGYRSSGAGLLEDGPPGALRAPTTVVWGCNDPALQREICVEGMLDYTLARGSHVVDVRDVAHWVPSDGRGPGVIARIVQWAFEGEKEELEAFLVGEKNVNVKKLR